MFKQLIVTLSLIILGSCGAFAESDDYTPMSFEVEDTEIFAFGVIDETSLTLFKEAMAKAPDADTLVLEYVEGSADDEANLVFARFVHDSGFSTRVPANGLVASGGTDLFLSGVSRTLESGACVGVHSWATNDENGEEITGADFPRNAAEHQPYLDYYHAVGIPQNFYWFTLEAAPADGMYWVTQDDIDANNMTTEPSVLTGTQAMCDER